MLRKTYLILGAISILILGLLIYFLPLRSKAAQDNVKEFSLYAKEVKWEIMPGVVVNAMTYNGQVPGPEIRVKEGDRVRVILHNELKESTTIHWHGLIVPNDVDGVPGVSPVVKPGMAYTYEFTIKQPAGTYWYHPHIDEIKQITSGMYGAFIIDDKEKKYDRDYTVILSEWTVPEENIPRSLGGKAMESSEFHSGHEGMKMKEETSEKGGVKHEMHMHSQRVGESGVQAMMMGGHGGANFFTINGKSAPAIPPLVVKKGERVRIRFINAGNEVHPMHLHGHVFKVIATDGHPLKGIEMYKDIVPVNAGERYDVEFIADNPGEWAFHCHDLHHLTNNGVYLGGLHTILKYE